jgi:hypothetical protein
MSSGGRVQGSSSPGIIRDTTKEDVLSREIDVNKPDSWSDDDKAYLRDRVDTVPVEHRQYLDIPRAVAPEPTALSPDVVKLTTWLRDNYPEEMGSGEPAVDVAIRLLSDSDEQPPEPDDDYDNWKVNELRAEAANRQIDGASSMTKQQAIDGLRKWDAEHPQA